MRHSHAVAIRSDAQFAQRRQVILIVIVVIVVVWMWLLGKSNTSKRTRIDAGVRLTRMSSGERRRANEGRGSKGVGVGGCCCDDG